MRNYLDLRLLKLGMFSELSNRFCFKHPGIQRLGFKTTEVRGKRKKTVKKRKKIKRKIGLHVTLFSPLFERPQEFHFLFHVLLSLSLFRRETQMWLKQSNRSSFRESVKSLEADIYHANRLAASISRSCSCDCIQMRLSYSPFAPFILFLIEWMDFNCTDILSTYLGLLHVLVYKVYVDGMPSMCSQDRKATLREFYTVIYPSLRMLQGELEDHNNKSGCSDAVHRMSPGTERMSICDKDVDRENECGICMDACSKMVLPFCGHSMCNSCFHDWNLRSPSCPFCRHSLNSVSSTDLWVLTSNTDTIDPINLAKENRRLTEYTATIMGEIPKSPSLDMEEYMTKRPAYKC